MQNGEEKIQWPEHDMELVISDATVEKIMGGEPIPSLDIEMPEIQNELQRKMAEEIQCVMCLNFPYSPLECKSCNKLFCKYCQLQLHQNTGHSVVDVFDQDQILSHVPEDKLMKMSPQERKLYAQQVY